MKNLSQPAPVKYTLVGAIFGFSFPLLSLFLDAHMREIPFSWSGILVLHQQNIVHYIVDLAPLVLGAAGLLLGQSIHNKNRINNSLKLINESLDTFTFRLTHDLRSPALNIKGLVGILGLQKEVKESEETMEILDKLNQAMDKWLDTFKDFAELLKTEKTGVKEKKMCDLRNVLKDVQDQLHLEIERASANITVDFKACKSVYASASDLNSVFQNLLTNAIKYGHPDRSPEIYIQSLKTPDRKAMIMVEDNGIGIDLSQHGDKLFKLFERVENETNADGTGIGLYLVRESIEKNNGTVEIDSTPGEGTSFVITLPTSAQQVTK